MTETVRVGETAHAQVIGRVIGAVAYLSPFVALGIVLPIILLFVTRKGTAARAHIGRALGIQIVAVFLAVLALLLMPIVTSLGGSTGAALDVYVITLGVLVLTASALSVTFAVGALLDTRWLRPSTLPNAVVASPRRPRHGDGRSFLPHLR